jgi:hypothetical protein
MSYFAMKNKEEDVSDFASWDERRLAQYFHRKGLGAYESTIVQHKITGMLAPLLTDDDLKEMGVTVVGDRLAFKLALKSLHSRARFHKRIETLWEGQEQMFNSECDKCCMTCGGFFPVDPSTYKLTTNHLRVKTVKPVRCGPVPLCCFGASYVSNNIDLSKVDDVDVVSAMSMRKIDAHCPLRSLMSILHELPNATMMKQ